MPPRLSAPALLVLAAAACSTPTPSPSTPGMLTGDIPDPVYALPGRDGWVLVKVESSGIRRREPKGGLIGFAFEVDNRLDRQVTFRPGSVRIGDHRVGGEIPLSPSGDHWVVPPHGTSTVRTKALLDRFPARDESSTVVTWALGGAHAGSTYTTNFAPLHGPPSYPGHTVLEGVVSDVYFGPTDVRPFLTRRPLDSFDHGGVSLGSPPVGR